MVIYSCKVDLVDTINFRVEMEEVVNNGTVHNITVHVFLK